MAVEHPAALEPVDVLCQGQGDGSSAHPLSPLSPRYSPSRRVQRQQRWSGFDIRSILHPCLADFASCFVPGFGLPFRHAFVIGEACGRGRTVKREL